MDSASAQLPPPPPNGDAATNTATSGRRRKRRRWGDAVPKTATTDTVANSSTAAVSDAPVAAAGSLDEKKQKALALQESIRARLAALKAGKKGTTAAASSAATVASGLRSDDAPPPTKRAKHYELDLQQTTPSALSSVAKPPNKVNPYLSHKETAKEGEQEGKEEEVEDAVDERLVRASKPRRSKELHFVEPGTFVEIAEKKRLKAWNAQQSGFFSGRKAGKYYSASNMASVVVANKVFVERPDCTTQKNAMPQIMEWWDMELLSSKLKKKVAKLEQEKFSKQHASSSLTSSSATGADDSQNTSALEALRQECYEKASLAYSKTATLIQHIPPVKSRHAQEARPPVLHLTKKELKRQRKLRRQEQQRELQDMQAAGLIPPPEPRLTLSNFIQVLGDQALVDPSQMEQRVQAQMRARQEAHEARNRERQLNPEQKRQKLIQKYKEDTTKGVVVVALFYVKDLSHTYHRAKVDLNAQQNYITGGVLECPTLTCIIAEGGPKAIQRYTRLLTVRMKWNLEDEGDGDGSTAATVKDNRCELVWKGMGVRRLFHGFVFQSCESPEQARRILQQKNVGHYWDQVVAHANDQGTGMILPTLAEDDEESDDNDDDAMSVEPTEEDADKKPAAMPKRG